MAMHHCMHDIAEEALKNYAVHLRQFAKNAKSTDFERSQNTNIALWAGMLAAYVCLTKRFHLIAGPLRYSRNAAERQGLLHL